METRPGFLDRVKGLVGMEKTPSIVRHQDPRDSLVPPPSEHKESLAEMMDRVSHGGKNPRRWAALNGRWVLWTDTHSIQSHIFGLEKQVRDLRAGKMEAAE